MPKPPKKKASRKQPVPRKPTNGDLGLLIEALRDDVRQAAEGQSLITNRIETLQTDLTSEIEEKYDLLTRSVMAVRTELSETMTQIREELQTDIRMVREDVRAHMHTP